MAVRFHRRKFLKNTAGLAAAAVGAQGFAAPAILANPSPNSKLNIAGIGVGGRGRDHVQPSLNENLVAVCDVVEGTVNTCLGQVEQYYKEHGLSKPLPKKFSDYREMFDKMRRPDQCGFCRRPRQPSRPGLDDGDQAGQTRLL